MHRQLEGGTGSAITHEKSYNGNTADPVLILVCFVNSLFKYIQTAFQFLGQRYGLVKTSRVFSQCDNPKFPFCFLWQVSFPALQSVRRLGPPKKGEGRTCWNISWRLEINLLFSYIHFLQREGGHLPNLKPLPMILVITLYIYT